MPKIPVYEQQVRTNPTFNSPVQPLAPVEGAFGGDIAAASTRLGSVVQGIGDKLVQHMTDLQERKDKQQVLDTNQAFTKDMQNILFDQTADEKGRPKGLMFRQLASADGASIEYDQKIGELKQKYMDSVSSDGQKAELGHLMEAQYLTHRDDVHKHEATQLRDSYNQSVDANLKTQVGMAAAISDPVKLAKHIELNQSVVTDATKRMGTADQNVIDFKNKSIADEMVKTSVQAQLEKNPTLARSIFEANKDKMSPDSAAAVDKVIAGKEIYDQQEGIWNQVKGYKQADGTSDLTKMIAFVNSLPADQYPTHKREEIKSFIKAQAGEANQIKSQQDKAKDFTFMNDLYGGKAKGVPLAQALTLANKYGDGAYDLATKKDIITKLYTQDTKTDPVTFMAYWTGVKEGTVTAKDIYDGYSKQKLSNGDFLELSKLAFKGEGDLAPAWDRVKILLEDKLHNSKEDQHKVLALLKEDTNANPKMTTEDLIKKANDYLDKDPSTGWFGLFKKTLYDTTYDKTDSQMKAMGQLRQDFGDNVDAIMSGAAYQNAKAGKGSKADLNDMNTYINTFGVDELKPGGKASNAIQLLRSKGKPVTIENIKYLMNQSASNGAQSK